MGYFNVTPASGRIIRQKVFFIVGRAFDNYYENAIWRVDDSLARTWHTVRPCILVNTVADANRAQINVFITRKAGASAASRLFKKNPQPSSATVLPPFVCSRASGNNLWTDYLLRLSLIYLNNARMFALLPRLACWTYFIVSSLR